MSGVYHAGELIVQKMAGEEVIAKRNGLTIRSNMSKGVAAFIKKQPLIIIASMDKRRNVWTSVLTGEHGFINVKNEVTLTINFQPVSNDPLIANLQSHADVGLLAIDFSKRARLRINGTGTINADRHLEIKTEQVYGNCPKYIQKRVLHPDSCLQRVLKSEKRSNQLSLEQQKWIRNADTFFIGSMNTAGKLDASHRGGSPGFIKVTNENVILFPDYFGNSMFNTLGNIHSNPNSGLLFLDFNYGHSLQLTGQSEIIWDDEELKREFPGAERLVRFKIDEVLQTENYSRIGWDFVEFSPANPTLIKPIKGGEVD
ncbi:pyridoxamine 5'-phosphate oxidase family protein [Siminovitchia fordii]|uniref:Pyridoxamine 5'-phosphate oxidase N-terminal domain-containing protein n=1 Tax=Siminovitchia fordii TaxID=254759 RepID=A0ABQ4KDU4_9BACI|nr:pyridoxamine 5'-phosphate oxidase family protein [Siminovitchia fordii]GIN23285.1 hypothetical protein J1TS3_44190 [Siminovitchia fordii]